MSLRLTYTSDSYLFGFLPALPVVRPVPKAAGGMGGIDYRLIVVGIPGCVAVEVKFLVGVSGRLMVRFSASPASPLVQTVVSPLHSSRGGPGNGLVALRWAVVQVSQAAPMHGKVVATRRTG